MCTNRKVHLSGTKKTLAARIIEYNKTTQSAISIVNTSRVAPSPAILDKENSQYLQMLTNNMDSKTRLLTQVLSEGFDGIM